MKKKVITIIVLVLFSITSLVVWGIFLGPLPSFNYGKVKVPGGIEFSSSNVFVFGYEMGTDSIYGYLYDLDRKIFFHMDSFLMAGDYVDYHSIPWKRLERPILIDFYKVILQDVKKDTSNFGVAFKYVVTADGTSEEFRNNQEEISLYVTFESLKDFRGFTAPDYVNFVSLLNDTSEIENHISLFKTASNLK